MYDTEEQGSGMRVNTQMRHYCALIIDRRPFPRFLGVLGGRRVSLFLNTWAGREGLGDMEKGEEWTTLS